MKLALLGAGHIGQRIAQLLHGCGDYELTVFDRDAAALERLSAQGLVTRALDSDDLQRLASALRGHEVVVNALPHHRAVAVAMAAREARCHYFDLTEDVAATDAIRRMAQQAATAFMPQCGLAPGFVGVAAHHLAQGFDELHEVKMRVGALPAFPTNALKYNLTWSVDGLVNEYCRPCESIRDGQRLLALPLEGLEHFSHEGAEYEAFNTSGGLGTLCETLAGRVRNLDYKTVRYPGHCELMKFLLGDMGLRSDPETLKALLRRALPTTMQDVVLVFVTASGLKKGALVQEVFARKVFARHEGGRAVSAIQITTAAGVCAAVDLFRQGRLPRSGFIRQEQLALDELLANRFGRAFEQERQAQALA